ncbi:MAG TPA: hypothetical protein H9669_00190 [Firmicutes bacterium]|nr:hypothetical protein [Bacillota bacterium]
MGFAGKYNTLPASIPSFLEEHDFSARIIIPFAIGEGNQLSSISAAVSRLQPGALSEKTC